MIMKIVIMHEMSKYNFTYVSIKGSDLISKE